MHLRLVLEDDYGTRLRTAMVPVPEDDHDLLLDTSPVALATATLTALHMLLGAS